MADKKTHFNNVCYCKCHELSKGKCTRCRFYHRADEKPVTHPNDTANPSYPVE